MRISDQEWDTGLGEFHRAHLTHGPDNPEGHLESGHWLTLDHPDDEHSKPQWSIVIKHPGDPSGHWIRANLGHRPEGIGQRALRELAHPEVMAQMREQMKRADWAGDPDGTISAHGGPGSFSPAHHEFWHWGE